MNGLRTGLVLALVCVATQTSAQPVPPDPQPGEHTAAPGDPAAEPEQVQAQDPDPSDPPPAEPPPADPPLADPQPTPDEPPQGDPIGTDPDSADGPQSPVEDDTDEDPDELDEAHRPQIELRVGDGELYTGDVVTVTLTALAPARDDISVPSEQDVAPFEILDTDVRTEERGDGVLHTFTLELLALEPGEHVLAPFRIRVLTPDGVIGHVETEPLTIRVASVLGNEPNAEPRPPTEPVPLLEEDPTLYWVGGALLLILLTALFTWIFARWWRAREKAAAPPPPPRPPEDIALEKLNALRQRRDAMLREGQGVEFVDHVSDAVREYLGHRFSFEGLESTTDEVLARMRKRKLRGVGIDEIAGLLQDCDLVKFAKADFTLEQSELLLSGSFRIVRATTNEMSTQAPEAKPAAARAPERQDEAAAADPAEARWMPKPPEAPQPEAPQSAVESASNVASATVAEARSIPDTVPPGTKAAAELAVAAVMSADNAPSPAGSPVDAEAPAERPIPDTLPPMAPSSGDGARSADTLRGLAFDANANTDDATDASEGDESPEPAPSDDEPRSDS